MKRTSIVNRASWFLIGCLLAAAPATAGIGALFADGFEGGDTDPWGEPVRFVVFEGFYNPG